MWIDLKVPSRNLWNNSSRTIAETLQTTLRDPESSVISTLREEMDLRSNGLEQHLSGSMAQVHADLEQVNEDLQWISEKVDTIPATQAPAQGQGSQPTTSEILRATRTGPFASIPVKTPYKPSGKPDQTTASPAPNLLPHAMAQTTTTPGAQAFTGPMPPMPRPQLPKIDEYPTYDGKVESSHREF